MNLRPTKRLAAVLVATGATAALVLTSPVGADAAKMITGKDIKNSSITGKDIKNKSLTAKDFKPGQLPGTAGATGPAGPAGAPGKDAAQPTTASFRADLPASASGDSAAQSSANILPAFSQVAGVNITSSTDLGVACGTAGYSVDAALGQVTFLPLVYVSKNPDTTALQALGIPQTTGPVAQPMTVFASCNDGDIALPATSITVTYTVAAQNTTPSVSYTGTAPLPAGPVLMKSDLQKMLDR